MSFKISDALSKKIVLLQLASCMLVLYIHSSGYANFNVDEESLIIPITNYITRGITLSCVPMFALISGFLFFKDISDNSMNFDYYKRKISSRLPSICLPYLIWNIIGMMFVILISYTALRNYVSGVELFQLSIKNIFSGIFLYKYNGNLWYLFYIMKYVIISPIIYALCKNKYTAIPYLVFCFILGIVHFDFIPDCLQENGYNILLFFSIGSFVAINCPEVFNKKCSKPASIIAGIAFLIVSLLKLIVKINFVVMLLRVVAVFCLWIFFDIFDNVKIKNWMKMSFFVYLSHGYVLVVISKLFCIIYNKTGLNVGIGVLINTIFIPLFVFATLCFIGLVLKKHFPKLWKIIAGGRG